MKSVDVRSHENAQGERASILESSRCSAYKHMLALTDRPVERILHSGLHYHPYKLAIVHKLCVCDFNCRRNTCEAILENVSAEAIAFYSDKAHFHVGGYLSKSNMHY
ncbi:hypothetical protein Trydic_g7465 [Trypoxylus dichotomus]